ncbi:heat shock protein Hsp-16.1/Hsp-16.11 [Lepeophtheirus salmonis]|uniref:heat shock protein Hsp-16.1/Hsp-16.11 n=1 Tax=Lepeophtheirus salmonis TaxID=72036 RepID=UPI001AE8AC16|nr:heat shock protein Hsp-16.1/Hsp-16.11-like [Lepeophtheirus salmonis]
MSRVPMTLRDVFWQDPFFESTWSDFDKIRENMMKESNDFWKEVPEMNTLQAIPPKRNWMLSRQLSKDGNAPESIEKVFQKAATAPRDDSTIHVLDDDKKFEISLDTHLYRPEELKVHVDENRFLCVEGKHEVKEDGRFISTQFSRKYTLPKDCIVEEVGSNLSSDGILMITAPKKQQAIEKK